VREGDRLVLSAFVADPDGARLRRGTEAVAWPASEDEAAALGVALGNRLRLERS